MLIPLPVLLIIVYQFIYKFLLSFFLYLSLFTYYLNPLSMVCFKLSLVMSNWERQCLRASLRCLVSVIDTCSGNVNIISFFMSIPWSRNKLRSLTAQPILVSIEIYKIFRLNTFSLENSFLTSSSCYRSFQCGKGFLS